MLSPKPTSKNSLYGWEYLDELLQANFKKQTKGEEPSLTINLNEFEMSFEEIEHEAVSKGYKVERKNESFVIFR